MRFRNAAVVDVRPNEASHEGGVVVLADASELEYDYLVIGVGAAPDGGAVQRARLPLASLEDARTLAGALRDMETKRANDETTV